MRDPWCSCAATTTTGRCLSLAAAAAAAATTTSTTIATTRAAAAATRFVSAAAMAAAVAQSQWTLEARHFGVSVLPFTPLILGALLFAEELRLFICQGLSSRQLFRHRWLVSRGPGGNGGNDGGCGELGCGDFH